MKGPLALGLVLAGILTPLGGTAHRKTEEGNRQYRDGAYEDALRAYTEAQVALPEAPELHYDIGNVLYRQGDLQGAAEAFTRALLSAPPEMAPAASYNLGNALFKQQRYDDALKAYRRTLESTPADGDAKRNFELALRALQRQKQEKQKQQPQQEPQEQKQQPKQSPSSGSESDKSQEKPKQDQGGGDPSSSGKPMSQEEVQRLLDQMADQERSNMERQLRRANPVEGKAPEKDW